MEIKLNLDKSVAHVQFIIFLLGFTLISPESKAQNSNKKAIVQSSYYDAVVLYYATKNYRAFPIEDPENSETISIADTSTRTAVNSGNPSVPLFPGQTPTSGTHQSQVVTKYKIVESTTGKIIEDNLTTDRINAVLQENQFSDTNERKSFIYEVLARNVGVINDHGAGFRCKAKAGPTGR